MLPYIHDPITCLHRKLPSHMCSHHMLESHAPITCPHACVISSHDCITCCHHMLSSRAPTTCLHHMPSSRAPIACSHHMLTSQGPITWSHTSRALAMHQSGVPAHCVCSLELDTPEGERWTDSALAQCKGLSASRRASKDPQAAGGTRCLCSSAGCDRVQFCRCNSAENGDRDGNSSYNSSRA